MKMYLSTFIFFLFISIFASANTPANQNLVGRSYMYGTSLQNGYLLSQKKAKTRTAFMLARLQDGKVVRIQVLPQKIYSNLSDRLTQIQGLLQKTEGTKNCKQTVSVSLEDTKTIPHFCLDNLSASNMQLIQHWLQEATDYTPNGTKAR